VIDGFGVDGSAWLTRFISRVSMWWDKWIVDGLVNLSGRIIWLFSFPVRLVQNGLVQSYALLMVLGILVIFGYYLSR
jgi:NADH-quinone oxidoreductase subunit L